MNEDLYFSPLTDATVLAIALQEAYNSGAGVLVRPWHEAKQAVEQRLTGVRNWWERGFVEALYEVELLSTAGPGRVPGP